MSVAQAEPGTPMAGRPSHPKMKMGSSTTLTALAASMARSGVRASPAARSEAPKTMVSIMVKAPPETMRR